MYGTGHGATSGLATYERRVKGSHRDTVIYEIDMLRFCSDSVLQRKSCEKYQDYLYLEGFLLHYRNLLEFFGGARHHPGFDISMRHPNEWGGRQLTDTEVAAIIDPARLLDTKHYDDISTFLQHCTLRRNQEAKRWIVSEMRIELEPIIAAFVAAFPG